MVLLGLLMVLAGLGLVALGLLARLGPLPGDIYLRRDNLVIYVPVVSMLLLSVLLSCALSLLGRWMGR